MRIKHSIPFPRLAPLVVLVAAASLFVGSRSHAGGPPLARPATTVVPPIVTPPTQLDSVALVAGRSPISRSAGERAKLRVARTGGTFLSALTVNYKIGGSAVNGQDYAPLNGSVTIPQGESFAKIKIAPLASGAVGSVKIVLLPNEGYLIDGTANKVKVQIAN